MCRSRYRRGDFELMAVSFIVSLGTLLVLKDTKENQARIKTVDRYSEDIRRFFTGLATTLLR